jgi:hypothetical protein
MKITKLQLRNFKRFTHLQLEGIPAEARMVLLIGSNGSGKSSVFDAFEAFNKAKKMEGLKPHLLDYYKKDANQDFIIALNADGTHLSHIEISGSTLTNDQLKYFNFYGRSSFRQVSRLTRTSLGNSSSTDDDSDRPRFFIDRDERFENDIEKITSVILRDFFRTSDGQSKIKERYIDPINRALTNIFGARNGTKLELLEIIPPLEGNIAQVNFRKGKSEFHYNQLSAGEKEVINILINLASRRESLENAICFFDEIDLHLNTKLQFNLMQEIVENWIPESSQFWTASHSLGFIEYARSNPQAVILDFDDLDFDLPQTLTPVPKENTDVYEIAVGKEFLTALLEGKKLCFIENNDRDYYASIGLPNILFAKATNRNNVYHRALNEPSAQGIVDRDFLTDEDIVLIRQQYTNLYILPYYSIENLMYHPDNLSEYYLSKDKEFDRDDYVQRLMEHKNIVTNSIIPSLALKRTEYPYFGETAFNGQPKQRRFKNNQENSDQAAILAAYLQNDDFEIWYKVFPMKTYATDVPQRQNIPKSDLVKTVWFKAKIEHLFAV